MPATPSPAAARLVASLAERGLTIAVAESLTGGLLTAALVEVPGASTVLRGGIVAYATELKHALLGVDASLLQRAGAVDPTVAEQMAAGVRERCAIDGRSADLGVSTTGVAGPGPSDGKRAGLVYIGFAIGTSTLAERLDLDGDRDEIREQTVARALGCLVTLVEREF